MKYNVIGDIHGRTCWKKLVIDDGINIFVGDYFSPYSNISWQEQKQNFLDIIDYKEAHPETILLVGNHDEDHWHWCVPGKFSSGCSRHNFEHEQEIYDLFEGFKDYFLAAYAIEDKALVTHAGLGMQWYINNRYNKGTKHISRCWDLNNAYYNDFDNVYSAFNSHLDFYMDKVAFGRLNESLQTREDYELVLWKNTWYYWLDGRWNKFSLTPREASDFINTHWKECPNDFSFSACAHFNDYYGTSETHGPMWIRYQGIVDNNPFAGTHIEQVYGHTISEDFHIYYDKSLTDDAEIDTGKMVMVDCLEELEKSYVIEAKTANI